jgi:hypothetical protein
VCDKKPLKARKVSEFDCIISMGEMNQHQSNFDKLIGNLYSIYFTKNHSFGFMGDGDKCK